MLWGLIPSHLMYCDVFGKGAAGLGAAVWVSLPQYPFKKGDIGGFGISGRKAIR